MRAMLDLFVANTLTSVDLCVSFINGIVRSCVGPFQRVAFGRWSVRSNGSSCPHTSSWGLSEWQKGDAHHK